jgi:radical SAM protein with 4Fe4S-binding SPASM domain
MRGIFWEVTARCNLRCKHCYVRDELTAPLSTPAHELGTEDCIKLVEQFDEASVFYVTVLGGEPFCRPDFMTILKRLGEKTFWTSIDTNGTLIDEETARNLASIKIRKLNVSMEGPYAEVNDAIRGTGAFNKAVKGIGYLRDCGVPFRIGMIVSKANYTALEEMAEFCFETGAENAGFSLYVDFPSNRYASLLRLTRKEILEAAQKIREIKKKYPRGFISSDIDGNLAFLSPDLEKRSEPRKLVPCGMGATQLTILSNGDAIPCTYMRDIIVGNVMETHLSQIPATPEFKKIKALRTLTVDEANEQCRSCEWKYFCGGGCRARAYMEYGDLLAPDPHKCLMAKGETYDRSTAQDYILDCHQ